MVSFTAVGDTLLGGTGVLLGNDGNDSINGQSGADTIATGEGTDVVASDVADLLDEAFALSTTLLATLG